MQGRSSEYLPVRSTLPHSFYDRPPTHLPISAAEQLLFLLGDLLKVVFSTKLPSLSAPKIRLACFWALQWQHLPQEVLAPKASEILMSLMNGVEKSSDLDFQAECLKVGIRSGAHCILDFLTRFVPQVTAKLLSQYPGCFVPPFKDFLRFILRYLVTDNPPVIRNLATQVLCALASATVNGDVPTHIRRSQSKDVIAFINANTTRTPTSPDVSTVKLGPLAQRIHNALDNVNFETTRNLDTPSWAVIVVSSLIILSDASFFLHSRCLKLIIPVLSKISAWKRGKGIQELHPAVWKCIVWAFARLREAERLAKAGQSPPLEKTVDMRSVYSFTRQDLRCDVGVAIVATLLWTPDQGSESAKRDPKETWREREVENSEDVANALGILKDMLKNPDRHVRELGKRVLVRILSGIGASTSAEGSETSMIFANDWYNAFLAPQLFDNSILSTSQPNLLIRAGQVGETDVVIVPRLSENGVLQHWDELIGMWAGLVSRLVPERKMNLPVCLLLPSGWFLFTDLWSVFSFLG